MTASDDSRYHHLAAMIAAQRSGSHMLGAAIGSHPALKYTGEVFCRRVPGSEEQMWAIIERVRCGGTVAVLDVKYNQISPPVEELLRYIPVIHLVRRDIHRLYYSGALHTLRGRGEAGENDAPPVPLRKKDLEDIRAYRDKGIRRFGPLEDLRLFYEDLTDNKEIDHLPAWAGDRICHVLGVEKRTLTIGTLKEGPESIDGLLVGPKGVV